MSALRTTSKVLLLPPVAALLYDLVKGWFVDNNVKIRSLEKFWMWFYQKSYDGARPLMEAVLGTNWTQKLMALPAPVALLIPPIICYVIYWIIFTVKGGKSAGGFTYKSHD